MTKFSDADRAAVRAAIQQAEQRTSAEFVTVVAREAEPYLFIPTVMSAFATLLVSGLVLIARQYLPPFTTDMFYAGQVVLFTLLVFASRLPAIRYRLVPKSIKHARASRLAHELFLDLGLTDSEDRNAVLLFVALGERYVEVIADSGLQARLDDGDVWNRVIEAFVADVKHGRIADGFVAAVRGCADVMAEHFPNREGAENRYPDRLIEI